MSHLSHFNHMEVLLCLVVCFQQRLTISSPVIILTTLSASYFFHGLFLVLTPIAENTKIPESSPVIFRNLWKCAESINIGSLLNTKLFNKLFIKMLSKTPFIVFCLRSSSEAILPSYSLKIRPRL